MLRNRLMSLAAIAMFAVSCKKEINDQQFSAQSASNASVQSAGTVYTLSNHADKNEVLVYNRNASGELTFLNAYSTGGTGNGTGLGSQGAVVLSKNNEWLLAVNAGSNSISSFKIWSDGLQLVSTVSSGGTLPISVTEFNNIVYVLNAGGDGNISGFKLDDAGNLKAIANSVRSLSSASAAPAQISFTESGKAVVVTEKADNEIITYTVDEEGNPGIMHSVASSTPTPFGFAVGKNGYIYVSEAAGSAVGMSTVSSYHVSDDGSITLVKGSVNAGQTSACWVVQTNNGKYIFSTNAASGTISSFATNNAGNVVVLNGVAASTNASPIDAALSNNSKFLYVLNSANQTISSYAITNDGSLNPVQVATGLPISAVGLAAK